MRITNKLTFLQNINRYQSMQNDISKANNKIIDDRKFHEGYDDSASFSESMRLDNEISTFEQVKNASNKAVSLTKNSDQAVGEITKELDAFKSKLIQGANEIHSSTSLSAIANDLEQIRNHIVNITNTSINGQFLFSGTAINTKPFDDEGNYHGNDENMKVLLGSNVQQSYNISGAELMLGRDNDYHKVVSTNERILDRRYDINDPTEHHYLTKDSKIRDLIGKEYLHKDEQNKLSHTDNFFGYEKFPPTYFYVSGTKGDGHSFRAKFSMKDDENISAMLKKIGEIYGNTDDNELVKVELTKSGTIEITDLVNDNSRLNFSMFAATSKSSAEEVFSKQTLEKVNKDVEANRSPTSQLPLEPALIDGKEAKNKADVNSLKEIKELANKDEIFLLNFCNNANLTPEGEMDASNYAKTQFNPKDQFLRSNITQYLKTGGIAHDNDRLMDASIGDIETDPTKPHTVLEADINSKVGNKYHIKIDLTASEVSYEVPNPAYVPPAENQPADAAEPADAADPNAPAPEPEFITRKISFTQKVYDLATHETYRRKSAPSEITFAQLNDMIGLFASDTLPNKDLDASIKLPPEAGQGTMLSKEDAAEYDKLDEKAQTLLKVSLKDGRMQLEDRTATTTNVRLSIYDSINGDDEFNIPEGSVSKSADSFTFTTNSSLVIDEQQLDIIKDLDRMIEAVRAGEYRSDSDSKMKNPGIQAAIRRLDHISDHIRKTHTKIGATQSAIESARDRAEAMQVNIQDVKNVVMGSGPDGKAEAIMQLTTSMNTFQALLQTSAMVNKLSLLDYMR